MSVKAADAIRVNLAGDSFNGGDRNGKGQADHSADRSDGLGSETEGKLLHVVGPGDTV
jgi:hypothetical protein